MNISVGVAPAAIPIRQGDRPVIQNLGPGDLYIDTEPDVTTASGIKIVVDGSYEFPMDPLKTVYAVASVDATDVRVMVVG